MPHHLRARSNENRRATLGIEGTMSANNAEKISNTTYLKSAVMVEDD
jgi:hypothetical protein